MTKVLQAQRRALASEWLSENPVLDAGEMGFETDSRIYKVGDGVTAWNQYKTPYIPTKLFNAKGDIVTLGKIPRELLTNNAMNVDSDSDGVADNWTLVGTDHTYTSVTSSGQSMTSPASGVIEINTVVPVSPGYTYAFNTTYNFIAHGNGGQHQIELRFDFYTDAALTNLDAAQSEVVYPYYLEPLGVNTDSVNNLSYTSSGYLKVTIAMHDGASAVYSNVSLTENHIDLVSVPITGAVAGSNLYVDGQGNLKWTTVSQATKMAPYITSADMASTYKTKSAAETDHSQYILAADAASTYETIANANIAHALHQYAAAAATDYHTPASLLAASFEPKDEIHVKAADTTVTNQSAYTAVPDLSFAMVANGTYLFELFLIVSGTTANGLRVSTIAATASSYIFGVHAPVNGAGVTSGNVHQAVSTGTGASPGTQSIGIAGVGVPLFATLRGTVFNGTSAGTFAFSMAQNSAAASTYATIQAGSFIRAIKIA